MDVHLPISRAWNVLRTALGRGLGSCFVGGTGSFLAVPMEKMW
jgi:hypothetical protein